MKFICNCASWISDEFLSYINDNSKGKRIVFKEEYSDHELCKLWISKGYDINKISYTFFFKEDFEIPVTLPAEISNAREFWISKLQPGDMIPWHYDTFKHPLAGVKRYWMALQDPEPGHVFFYKDQQFTDYKKGDVFLFERPDEWHGACNVGFTNKLTLQFTVIEDEK